MRVGFAILMGISVLTACSGQNSAEGLLRDYVRRVERAAGIEGRDAQPVTLLPYPAERELILPVADIRIGMLEYLKLYDCPLFNLISERNSILGKVMPVSKVLAYELRFLREADACYARLLQQPQPNREFMEAFSQVIRIKRANLANLFWNATFAGPDLQTAFSLAAPPLDPDDQTASINSRQAVEYLHALAARIGDSARPVEPEVLAVLEDHYFTLRLHRYGGRLVNAAARLIEHLNQAAAALERLGQGRPVCYQRKPSRQGRILHTVFLNYYASGIGPYLAQIHRESREWLSAVDALIATQPIPIPAAFARYRAQMLSPDKGLWQQLDQAVQRHTRAWQTILGQCGLLPGSGDHPTPAT